MDSFTFRGTTYLYQNYFWPHYAITLQPLLPTFFLTHKLFSKATILYKNFKRSPKKWNFCIFYIMTSSLGHFLCYIFYNIHTLLFLRIFYLCIYITTIFSIVQGFFSFSHKKNSSHNIMYNFKQFSR